MALTLGPMTGNTRQLETVQQFYDILSASLIVMATQMLEDPKFIVRFGCLGDAKFDSNISTFPKRSVSEK